MNNFVLKLFIFQNMTIKQPIHDIESCAIITKSDFVMQIMCTIIIFTLPITMTYTGIQR